MKEIELTGNAGSVGTMTIVPGINFMPWDVFGFIDDSIDCISTPFSGPRGDYSGAARKAEYADAPLVKVITDFMLSDSARSFVQPHD